MDRLLQFFRSRRLIIVVLLLLVFVLFLIFWRVNSYQTLVIDLIATDSGPVKVYDTPRDDDGDVLSPAGLEPVEQTDSSTSLDLRRGTYTIVGGESDDYQAQVEVIDLGNEPGRVVIDPSFSSQKLAEILEGELAEIKDTITSEVPGVGSAYTTAEGRLYDKGQWYGTVIYPNESAEQLRLNYVDVFRIILEKRDDEWVVVTLPPELVLSTVNYPSIPRNILIDTNKQTLP